MANQQREILGCLGPVVVVVLCIIFCIWGPRDDDVINENGLTFGQLTNICP